MMRLLVRRAMLGITLIATFLVVAANVMIDRVYAFLDPGDACLMRSGQSIGPVASTGASTESLRSTSSDSSTGRPMTGHMIA